MHSTIIALLATTAGFTVATPLSFAKRTECPSSTKNSKYYVCGNNGFRGYCSVDPCAKPWCPDFKLKTCDSLTFPNVTAPVANCSGTATTTVHLGTTTTTIQTGTTTTTFCSSKTTPTGCSSTTKSTSRSSTSTSTSCSSKTTPTGCSSSSTSTSCSPKTTPPSLPPTVTPTVCAGTATHYVCSNNGFKGSCSVDPCALNWCPDYVPKTCHKAPVVDTTTIPEPSCTGSGAFYVCANNGFRGNCSVDPCALAWCPDYELKTCKTAGGCGAKETKPEAGKNKSVLADRRQDNNGVCPEGTGYYQVCGNGFRGCCKADACGQASPICPPSSW